MSDARAYSMRIERKLRRRFNKHSRGVRITAVFLAVVMAFSALGANLTAIVDMIELLTVHAADLSDPYYDANITLYDYYCDNEINGSGGSANEIFNKALYDSGYTAKAEDATHTWSDNNLVYFPLYLGLQYPHQNNMMQQNASDYFYSIAANSQAGTNGENNASSEADSGASWVPIKNASGNYAAVGTDDDYVAANYSYAKSYGGYWYRSLVDEKLTNGELTQGNGKVKLPYFDEELLDTSISKILSSDHLADIATANQSKTLGRVKKGTEEKPFIFKFKKITSGANEGYYQYDAAIQSLGYETNATYKSGKADIFTVEPTSDGKLIMDNASPQKNGFFPWDVMGNTASGSTNTQMGYAAKFEIPFTMSSNGQTAGGKLINFKFSGDDDVWVFVDDYLVLDIGGAHGKVGGEVSFQKNNASATVTKIKKDGYINNPVNMYLSAFAKGAGDVGLTDSVTTDLNSLFVTIQ